MSQREISHQILTLATEKAKANGLDLIQFEDSAKYPDINLRFADRPYFRLSYSNGGALIWAVDLWPSGGEFALMKWDPDHKGPFLDLPRFWTILDAVNAMIEAKAGLAVCGRKATKVPGRRKSPRQRKR